MSVPTLPAGSMRALRLHAYGDPADVLRLEGAPIPSPGPGAVRIRVQACGLNPADWALCRGLFARNLPRGVGLDVAGVVDALGEGVGGVAVGEALLGPANYLDHGSAGAADYAVLDHWTPMPPGLGMTRAAALPMAVETAYRYLAWLGVTADHTLLVNGGGTTVGFAAVQIARLRGARVIATAGETFAEPLRAMGAVVTGYGDGMVERVRALAGGAPDLIFDTAPLNLNPSLGPPGGVVRELIEIAGGDGRRVITCGDFGAAALGARTGLDEAPTGPGGALLRWDVLGDYARLAAEGRFAVPIARTFAFEQWCEALALSLSGRAHGKLILLPGDAG